MAEWGQKPGWVHLEYDDEEMADKAAPSMPSQPQYPYGCRICWTGRELEMFGLGMPGVGDLIDFRAMAEVTCVSDDGSDQRVEMTITMVRFAENEDMEDEG